MPSSWASLSRASRPFIALIELAVLVAREEELVHLVDQRGVVDREDLPEHLFLSSQPWPAGRTEEARIAGRQATPTRD